MPVETADPTGLFDVELTWTEADGYAVADGEILQTFILDHIDRHTDNFSLSWYDDNLTFSLPDATGPQNRYRIEPDGTMYSGYGVDDHGTDNLRRHTTITESRMNALIGRTNKTQELIDYIPEFDEFNVADTVFRRYCEEPVLAGTDLKRTILQEHGSDRLETIEEERPELFHTAGAARIPEYRYDDAVDAVAYDGGYGSILQAAALDYEVLTKGRDMQDWYDISDREARQTARQTHRTVMGIVADRLDKEDIYNDVMDDNQLVHGTWPS